MTISFVREDILVDIFSSLLSLGCVLLFIWGSQPTSVTVQPFHVSAPQTTVHPVAFDFSSETFLPWWPSHHMILHALDSTRQFTSDNFAETSKRRRRDGGCLTAPSWATHIKRRTAHGGYLVDYTSSKGGVPSRQACPGFPDFIPDFRYHIATWLGCTHPVIDGWTGYVCKHPLHEIFALKCFRFDSLEACHLGSDMPCKGYPIDMGCRGGLMAGETCTQKCPNGTIMTGEPLHQTSCPLVEPVCTGLCPPESIPKPHKKSKFTLPWMPGIQKAIVEAKNPALTCFPKYVSCKEDPKFIRCELIACGPLYWAGIEGKTPRGAQRKASCPKGFLSAVPYVMCGLDGTWSHTNDACIRKKPPTIMTVVQDCINNKRQITKKIIEPGYPPVGGKKIQTWLEKCTSPPPHCCPSPTLDASDGYYDENDNPRCRCRFAKIGFSNPSPCCSLEKKVHIPPLSFHAKLTGTFILHACNNTCSAHDCYTNTEGCIAFNRSHFARHARYSTSTNSIIEAFTWNF